MSNDAKLLAEAYQRIIEEECKCSYAKNGCDCEECTDCKHNQKVEESAKPDYLDVDKDGDEKESMKKALDDKEKKGVEEALPAIAARVVAGHALKNALTGDKEEVEEAGGTEQLSQQALQIMADLKARDPKVYDMLIARLNDLANGSEQPDEYEHKGWPGDGSGEDDFADYNQNEGNDY